MRKEAHVVKPAVQPDPYSVAPFTRNMSPCCVRYGPQQGDERATAEATGIPETAPLHSQVLSTLGRPGSLGDRATGTRRAGGKANGGARGGAGGAPPRRRFVIIAGGETKGASSYGFGLVLGLSFILLLRTWRVWDGDRPDGGRWRGGDDEAAGGTDGGRDARKKTTDRYLLPKGRATN